MSRFGGRGREERSERGGREERGGRSAYRGGRGGKGRGYGGGSRRRGNDSGFVNLGSVTTKKGTKDSVVDDLRDSKIGLWITVYMPDGETVKLKHEDRIFVQLGQYSDKAPDFVVGSASIPPSDGGGRNDYED